MNHFIPTILILTLISCTGDLTEPDLTEDIYECQTASVVNDLSRQELVQSFDEEIIQGIASIDIPDADGAMGRNKKGYFHVRFQMGISAQADYAIYNENSQALEYAIRAIEYAFEHQLADGSFDLVVPSDLSDQTPTDADLASGVSFFLSSLGLALNNFKESSWYHSPSMATYKERIENLRPNIESAAEWLLNQKQILETADQNAPNRLFFNAVAFYSLGKWTDNPELISTGISFANTAISKKHPNGYFIEGGGWDSSYQGVAVKVGFDLYSILSESEPLKPILWDNLSCAADWQMSRILENGVISTQGNTRVYPGGESFLGQEKQVDWIKSMVAMFVMGYYSDDSSFLEKANKIKQFYR